MGTDKDRRDIRPGSGAGLGPTPEPGDIAGGTGMAEAKTTNAREHRIGMILDARGPKAAEALDRLNAALDVARVGEPDEHCALEVVTTAPSLESAMEHVWNATAAAGVDDQLRLAEHPELPEHWRRRVEGES